MKIDWFTFGVQIVNFLVLLYLLRRFLYGPITKLMQEREERIASQSRDAQRLQEEAIQAADEFRIKSANLETERHAMLERTKVEVDGIRKRLLEDARSDIDHRRNDWLQSLEREKHTLLQIIRQRCSRQVVDTSSRLVAELADSELDEQLYRSFLNRLSEEHAGTSSDAPVAVIVQTAHDVPTIWRDRIKTALVRHFNASDVEFDVSDEIVFGIEVHIGEQKIGWSARSFLSDLDDDLNHILENTTK
ncbi:MAG: hypothetical protein KDB27_06115 [Planctomycetales bacterium]|nr:hypothetical protein [Planctomycetales bacterium]